MRSRIIVVLCCIISGFGGHTFQEPFRWHADAEASTWWLNDSKCSIDIVDAASISTASFLHKYYLRQPVLIRGAKNNHKARAAIADAESFVQACGSQEVNLGDSWSLTNHGETPLRVSLREYINSWHRSKYPLYMFGSHAELRHRIGLQDAMLATPKWLQRGAEKPPVLSAGEEGSGIAFHLHHDAWNEVLLGAKRWAMYPPETEPHANPGLPQTVWLTEYPNLKQRPYECVQRAGDIMYVPETWPHATVNLCDTICVTRQASTLSNASAEQLYMQSQDALDNKDLKTALMYAKSYVKAMPATAGAHYHLGFVQRQLGQEEDALRCFKEAGMRNTLNPQYNITVAEQLSRMAQYDEADKVLESVWTSVLEVAQHSIASLRTFDADVDIRKHPALDQFQKIRATIAEMRAQLKRQRPIQEL